MRWKFDAGAAVSVANDSIGSLTRTLTTHSPTYQTDGVSGDALQFNGSNAVAAQWSTHHQQHVYHFGWIDIFHRFGLHPNDHGQQSLAGAPTDGFSFYVNTITKPLTVRLIFQTGDGTQWRLGLFGRGAALTLGQWVNVAAVVNRSTGAVDALC